MRDGWTMRVSDRGCIVLTVVVLGGAILAVVLGGWVMGWVTG